MTYENTADLPETLQITLPEGAQMVYIKAYNEALKREEFAPEGELSAESAAHAIGWQAVEAEFERSSRDGKWYRKGELEKMPEEEEPQGLLDKLKNLFTG